MAEGFLRSFDSSLNVYSAGTSPADSVSSKAIEVMREIGIDISDGQPEDVSKFLSEQFDYVITVCDNARETCPAFFGEVGQTLHIGFEDPANAVGTDQEILTVFRKVRDEIKSDFLEFYKSIAK
jgi:arsenate reductase